MINIRTEIKSHWQAYVVLAIGLCATIVGYQMLWPAKLYQHILVFVAAAGYVAWGYFVHRADKHKRKHLFIEYALIAFLGASMLVSLTF